MQASTASIVMMEIWKTHPVHTDYEVSDLGRVRRVGRGRGAVPGKVLKPVANFAGYHLVGINCKTRKVHILVLETFVSERPRGMECMHADDDKSNNSLTNLRWGTHAENYADRVRNGGGNHGTRNGNAYLTDEIASSIRAARAQGLTMRAIEEMTGVSLATVCRVVNGRSYV
jgi:hypothetical protein